MPILPDVLEPNLKVVFCGTAVSTRSAQIGAYYAGPGNQFWIVLAEVGLTPRLLAPQEFRLLPTFGIGLTDMVKERFGMDHTLRPGDFDALGARERIAQYAPQALAFNGKRAAKEFYGVKQVAHGRQPESLGNTAVFVLPSTSGAAYQFAPANRDRSLAHWQALADFVRAAESGD
ncbi:MAG TPA: mismatch-specific DNA-glycosylase [Aggregatilineales bacterium]|nr:mismatch-specific DNA-glycosylase [Aggregatilineales bacterium]